MPEADQIPLLRRLAAKTTRALARATARIRANGTPPVPPIPDDCDPETAEVIRIVQPYTLTSPERIMGLCEAVRYIERAAIPGAIVECGVWRGGSMMAAAMTLRALGSTAREIAMFDVFDVRQIPRPGEHDVRPSGGSLTEGFEEALLDPGLFKSLPAERVRELVAGVGYPAERLDTIVGPVSETIPDRAPEVIALCRLDTDYYESTAHEMRGLFPRIARGGILIVDDYGDFPGCKKAVDEYLAEIDAPLLLNRMDSSGRMAIVPGPSTGDSVSR